MYPLIEGCLPSILIENSRRITCIFCIILFIIIVNCLLLYLKPLFSSSHMFFSLLFPTMYPRIVAHTFRNTFLEFVFVIALSSFFKSIFSVGCLFYQNVIPLFRLFNFYKHSHIKPNFL